MKKTSGTARPKSSRTVSGKNTDTAKKKVKGTAAELAVTDTAKLKNQDIYE